jgi:hypothetical protein
MGRLANTPASTQPPAPVGAATPAENSPVLSLQIGVVVVAALYFAKEVLIPVTDARIGGRGTSRNSDGSTAWSRLNPYTESFRGDTVT